MKTETESPRTYTAFSGTTQVASGNLQTTVLKTKKYLDSGKPDSTDPVEKRSSRPGFFSALYPGGLDRTGLNWSKEATPPAFLACAYDDRMPEQLSNFFITLRKAGVNAELHIYSSGGHGFGVRSDRPEMPISDWQIRFAEWLGHRGFPKI